MQKAINAKMEMGLICWRDETHKKCILCGEIKLLSEFHKKGTTITPRCSECNVKFNYAKYKERVEGLKEKIFTTYGSICCCCGETERSFLTIDHVGGGGRRHRRELRDKYTGLYTEIVKSGFSSRYRILCIDCNWATRGGEACPHEKEAIKRSETNSYLAQMVF